MSAEPELGQSGDPRELVRGDVAAVRATARHLADLADGFSATAGGLRATDVGAWTGAAADAFRARFADAPAQWSRAAAAFGSAARAWERFGSTLAAAQDQAATAAARFSAGAVAVDRAHAVYDADMQRYLGRVAAGLDPGPAPVPDDAGAAEMRAARRMLADARARRDTTASDAAGEIAQAAALSPDPPTGRARRFAEAADWLGANAIELAHVAQGVGEGVEGAVQLVRTVNPADPYNLHHPGRFVENASAALSGAVDTLAHPLRLVTGLIGAGWASDPARAFGHLLPAAATGGARSALGTAAARAGRSALGAATPGVGRSVLGAATPGVGRSAVGAVQDAVRAAEVGAGRAPSLWADPRPTARPFAPGPEPARSAPGPEPGPTPGSGPGSAQAPVRARDGEAGSGAGLAEADSAAAERLERLGRDLPSRLDRLAPRDSPPDAHHDPERARQARLTRGDKDFSSPFNRRGTRKSHLDGRGDLVPASPEGAASTVEHVVGRRSPVKGDSPYSSFTGPGAHAAVRFGGFTIEVDVVRLQADIDAGLVSGVEVLAPHRVQAAIQADADRIAGRPVDLYVRKGHVGSAARSYGLGAEATAQLRQRMVDMANAQRHHEWMIRGVVPGRYIVGPHSEHGHSGGG